MNKVLRRVRPVLVAVAAAVLAGGALSAPAGAVSPGGNPGGATAGTGKPTVPAGWAKVYAMQARLDAAATAVLAAGGAGNASVVVSPVRGELDVYWHGPVPARVQALARTLGVRVRFAAAAFPLRTLAAQARRLAEDPRVAEAAPRGDGGGVSVTLADTLTPSAQATAQQALRGHSPVALTFATGPRPRPAYSRQADTPPFFGGSRIYTPAGFCSNGFALSVPGSAAVFELSAGHCGQVGQWVYISGQPFPAGTIVSQDTCRDSMLIQYPAGVVWLIYNGAFDTSAATNVAGAAPDFFGDWVETGGPSGEHLNIQVGPVDVFAGNGSSCSIGPLIEAGYSDNSCAASGGDSGGPVYTYNADGSVTARGTISAAFMGTATCPGDVSQGSNTVLYAPLLRPDGDSFIGTLQALAASDPGTTILTG